MLRLGWKKKEWEMKKEELGVDVVVVVVVGVVGAEGEEAAIECDREEGKE